jgi:hypothetical protein
MAVAYYAVEKTCGSCECSSYPSQEDDALAVGKHIEDSTAASRCEDNSHKLQVQDSIVRWFTPSSVIASTPKKQPKSKSSSFRREMSADRARESPTTSRKVN